MASCDRTIRRRPIPSFRLRSAESVVGTRRHPKGSNLAKNAQMPGVSRNKNSLPKREFRASKVRTGADIDCAASADPPRSGRQQTGRLDKETSETLGVQPFFQFPAPTAPPVHFPTTLHRSIDKTISDQYVKPCWKNRPTLKLRREFGVSERKRRNAPLEHHQARQKKLCFQGGLGGHLGR